MAKKSVLCITDTEVQAAHIVDQLRTAGFDSNDISALFPDTSGTRDFALEKGTKAPEGAATGAGAGAVLGGTFGWLAGVGALAIPGVGPLLVAGPIAAALSGAAVGGAVGGITGSLIGMGIPEYEAKRFEGKIRKGGILLSVHTENSDRAQQARQIFDQAEAHDISTATEAGVDKDVRAESSSNPEPDKPRPGPVR